MAAAASLLRPAAVAARSEILLGVRIAIDDGISIYD